MTKANFRKSKPQLAYSFCCWMITQFMKRIQDWEKFTCVVLHRFVCVSLWALSGTGSTCHAGAHICFSDSSCFHVLSTHVVCLFHVWLRYNDEILRQPAPPSPILGGLYYLWFFRGLTGLTIPLEVEASKTGPVLVPGVGDHLYYPTSLLEPSLGFDSESNPCLQKLLCKWSDRFWSFCTTEW